MHNVVFQLRFRIRLVLALLLALSAGCGLLTGNIYADEATALETAALETAMSYLEMMPFSRNGLISQLEFAGFSAEQAAFAADNCGADWNEMAVQSAEFYLKSSDYSKQGLIRQLESEAEGFTHEQAVYGVETAAKDVDWKEMAVQRAAFYLRSSVFSRQGLIHQLESSFVGFTHEEAVYGVDIAGKDVNWNEMAVKKAASLLETGVYSENSLIHQLESESNGFTHDEAVYGVQVAAKDVDWNEMAARKAEEYLRVVSASRSELINYLESDAAGFTHEQAVYGADSSGASWADMVTVLAENLDNLFPIRGLEQDFMTPVLPAYSDVGAATAVKTIVTDGRQTIHLFTNPDSIHDYMVFNRVNSGNLLNFMFSMDVTIEDVFPSDQAGCFIGYVNELPAALQQERYTEVFLVADGNGAGFYRRTAGRDSGSFTRVFDVPLTTFKLTIIRFTGQTYAFINGEYAGQFQDTNAGPFQLAYGNVVYANGDSAVCSFDNLSVRKVNN